MSDISKCYGTDCPLAFKCYRYAVKEEPMEQLYLVEVPYDEGECDMFWDTGVDSCELCNSIIGDDNLCTNSECDNCPQIEFEGCESCLAKEEESGVEYIHDGEWKDAQWLCSHCGQPC